MGVGLYTIVQGVQALILNPADDWTLLDSTKEDLFLIDCPVTLPVQVVRVSATIELQT